MSFDEIDLFSKRCNHLDLETLPICDMSGNLIFNIHHYNYVKNNVRSVEVASERNDKILSIILVGDETTKDELAKIKTYMAVTATAILSKIDIDLFDGVNSWGDTLVKVGDLK